MSDYVRGRSESHEVMHVFSGREHHFDVRSVSGEVYQVSVKVSCTCPFMSREGIANGRFCSHVVAALRKMIGEK